MSAGSRLAVTVFGIAALATLFGCAVTGVGVEGTVGVGYDAGYYEPYGYDYGGWGGGYLVGPGRGRDHRDEHRDDHRDAHRGGAPAYHPAPAGRSAPSIPSRQRGH
jgi:hypothetical protein